MRHHRIWLSVLVAAHLLNGSLASADGGGPGAAANWSSFAGNGTFTPPVEGLSLIVSPGQARVAWRLNHPMGVQKTNAARDGEFYGGTACVIAVAAGLKIDVVTDYEVANEMAYWKGLFFTKTREGLAAIDVRLR